MKTAKFAAYCAFEIGDTVKIIKNDEVLDCEYKIDDILTIHSLRDGTVEFIAVIRDKLNIKSKIDCNLLKRIVKEQ